MDLNEAVEEWRAALVAEGIRAASVRSYLAHVRATSAQLATEAERSPGELSMTDWTLSTLRRALASYRTRPDARYSAGGGSTERSVASLRTRVAALRSFTRFCVEEGYLGTDFSARLRVPPASGSAPAALLAAADLGALRAAAATGRTPERDLLLLQLLGGIGASVGEVAALELTAWDAPARSLTLPGKAGRARTLVCPASVIEAVEAWLPVRSAWLERSGGSSTRLLVSPRSRSGGQDPTPDGLTYAVERVFARAGMELSGTHVLRASYAARALEAGTSPHLLQQVLGVESLAALKTMVGAGPAGPITPPVL